MLSLRACETAALHDLHRLCGACADIGLLDRAAMAMRARKTSPELMKALATLARIAPFKRHKYGVSKPADRTYNGVLYASKAEMQDAQEFDMLVKAGRLHSVARQVPLPFMLNGKVIFTHYVDFRLQHNDGRVTFCERKGIETAIYRLKMKLLHAQDPGLKDCYEVRKK